MNNSEFTDTTAYEFARILRDNARTLKELSVDEFLLPYVPFEVLTLDFFTIPFFSGTLDDVSNGVIVSAW